MDSRTGLQKFNTLKPKSKERVVSNHLYVSKLPCNSISKLLELWNSKDEESLDFDRLNSIVILKSPEKENTPIKVEGHTVSVI